MIPGRAKDLVCLEDSHLVTAGGQNGGITHGTAMDGWFVFAMVEKQDFFFFKSLLEEAQQSGVRGGTIN